MSCHSSPGRRYPSKTPEQGVESGEQELSDVPKDPTNHSAWRLKHVLIRDPITPLDLCGFSLSDAIHSPDMFPDNFPQEGCQTQTPI